MSATKGDKVKVDYKGMFEDGTVFDTSEGREPLEFEVGAGQVIKGFDEALIGMKEGEKKKVKILANEAYGQRDETVKQKVPRQMFPPELKMEIGAALSLRAPNGEIVFAKVESMDDQFVSLDFNHPLAGKDLTFELTLVSIATP